MKKFKTALFATMLSVCGSVNALQVIQGNSDEYIMTMETLNKANHLLESANKLLVEAHTEGYQLPNSNIKTILKSLSETRESLLILLRPEINRERTHIMTPSGDFVTNDLNEILNKHKEK